MNSYSCQERSRDPSCFNQADLHDSHKFDENVYGSLKHKMGDRLYGHYRPIGPINKPYNPNTDPNLNRNSNLLLSALNYTSWDYYSYY